jgi:hypothetical protein
MNTDEFFAEAKRLNLRVLGTPEETRAALDAKDAEIATLRGERSVLVRLLVEADKVLGTIDGESQEEWDMLLQLRRCITAATMPHRSQDADLLSIRERLGC